MDFFGVYEFVNPDDVAREVTFSLDFPAEQAIYDDVVFTLNGAPLTTSNVKKETFATAIVKAHETVVLNVGYKSQGLERWRYKFGDDVTQIKDFQLHIATDFLGFDFPENALSPTREHCSSAGCELAWEYKNLVSGYQIGIVLPQKPQPGPLAGRISYFAPVSLLFFFLCFSSSPPRAASSSIR